MGWLGNRRDKRFAGIPRRWAARPLRSAFTDRDRCAQISGLTDPPALPVQTRSVMDISGESPAMSIFSADGTLLQIGKNPADNLPQISFDELADLKDANNKIDEAQVRKYQNKTDRPADPPWKRTPNRAIRDNPRHGEWPLRTPIIDFTWHHLIPWEKLWGTWNGLAREKNWEMLKKLMTAYITGGPPRSST